MKDRGTSSCLDIFDCTCEVSRGCFAITIQVLTFLDGREKGCKTVSLDSGMNLSAEQSEPTFAAARIELSSD
jgi:hypothetical protein